MLEKKVILAIDDKQEDLNILESILVPQFTLRTARSASGALASLNSCKADLILLDVNLPNISGFEFLGDIRKIPSYMNIPVIVFNAKIENEPSGKANDPNIFDAMWKPIDRERLISTIGEALEAKETKQF